MSQYAGIEASAAARESGPPVASLEREQPVRRVGIGRPRVDDGEVDGHPARLRLAEGRDERVGLFAGLVLGADLGLRAPGRLAQQDRPPALGDAGRHPPVAGHRGRRTVRHDVDATRPAGGLMEERVLVEVGVRGQPLRR